MAERCLLCGRKPGATSGCTRCEAIRADRPWPEFEVGKTYEAKSAASHSWRPLYTVVARTAKFVTIEDSDGNRKRVGVKTALADNGAAAEWAFPDGRYSMALVLRAEREIVAN